MVWESSLNLTTERRKPLSLHLQRVFRSPTIDQEAIFGENYDLPHSDLGDVGTQDIYLLVTFPPT